VDHVENSAQLELLRALVGSWTTEGVHPLLPGEDIRGETTFEWLDGEQFLIMRAHYDHAQIPDAVTVTGVTDDQLSMHYFDSRGIYCFYREPMTTETWHFWRDDPGFAQEFTGTFSADGNTITGHGRLSRDGTTWDDDLALTYRRAR